MPKSRKKPHGSGKPKKPKPLVYDPVYTDKITKFELREALKKNLSLAELVELEKEISRLVNDTSMKASAKATEDAYERQFAVMMRVLKDRFGFGHTRLRRLWNMCLEYIHEIDEGLYSTEEMLRCLENEDGIRITWHVQLEPEQKGESE